MMSGRLTVTNSVMLLTALLALTLENSLTNVMARPASYKDYLAVEGDMVTVGSLTREVRQPAPLRTASEVDDLLSSNANQSPVNVKKQKNASGKSDEGGLYKIYGSDAEGEKGYLKKTYSKGDHGYKSLDTFHKTIGDKYGFQEHEAFGKEDGKDEDEKQAKSGTSSRKHKQSGDHEGAGTDVETTYADDGGDGEGEYYSSGGGGSYEGGSGEGYSENYSSGDGDGYSSGEAYSSDGGESSSEGDGYY